MLVAINLSYFHFFHFAVRSINFRFSNLFVCPNLVVVILSALQFLEGPGSGLVLSNQSRFLSFFEFLVLSNHNLVSGRLCITLPHHLQRPLFRGFCFFQRNFFRLYDNGYFLSGSVILAGSRRRNRDGCFAWPLQGYFSGAVDGCHLGVAGFITQFCFRLSS